MKLKTLITGVALVVTLMTFHVQAETKTYEIDAVHSSVDFKIRHLGISWVRGNFQDFKGEIVVDEANPANSKISVTVQAASIDTNNEKRDAHLQDADFFNTKEHATLSFVSTSVKKSGDNTYEVTGDLTLLGTTKSVTVTMTDSGEIEAQGSMRRGGEISEFTIKRSDFGMDNMVGPIGDTVHLYLAFSSVKK